MDYEDILYNKYISSGHFDPRQKYKPTNLEKEYNVFDKNISKYLPKNKSLKILEIGFGVGVFLSYLKNKGYRNFYGIEIGEEQYDFTRLNITKKVELVKDTIKWLKKHKEEYDCIILLDVLEHITKDSTLEILSSINASLKDSGLLIVKVPNASNPLNLELLFIDFTHTTLFTEKSIKQLLFSSGFDSVQVKPFNEETRTLRGKVASFIQKISFFILRIFLIMLRLYYYPFPLTRNLFVVAVK